MRRGLRGRGFCLGGGVLALLAASWTPGLLWAQSIYSAAGLGLLAEPLDARARALGSFGVGLWGSSLLSADPASAALLSVPRATIVAQPSWVEYERGGEDSGRFQGNRFPSVALGYPLVGGLATVHFGSFFDQRYRAQRDVPVTLESGTVEARESFVQDGAAAHASLGYSRLFLDGSVALGARVGRYVGSLARTLTRDFQTHDSLSAVAPYELASVWTYSGWTATMGASADVRSVLRLAASATWSEALKATPSEATDGDERLHRIPSTYRTGFTLAVSEGLRLSASAVYADWSVSVAGLADDVAAGSVFGYGVGLELSRARVVGRGAPVRVGFRSVELPYVFTTAGAGGGARGSATPAGVERVFSAGLGLPLAGSEEVTLAAADLAIERGSRRDLVLTENFWRATFSISVSGF